MAFAGRLPSIDEAARKHGSAVVAVSTGDVSQTAFFVTSSGLGASVLPLLAVGSPLTVHIDGTARPARVTATDASGLVLFQMEQAVTEVVPALAVRTDGQQPAPDAWLIALTAAATGAEPSLGGVRERSKSRWHLDIPAGAGAPVLLDGQVVAVVVERRGKTGSVAVPVSALLALVQQLRPIANESLAK
jgi:hypothetical protein